jgi:hypothetical protein
MIDLRGLSFEEAMAKVAHDVDRHVALDMARLEIAMIDDGVDRDQIDGVLEHFRAEAAAWREKHLAEVRAWLFEGREPSQILH